MNKRLQATFEDFIDLNILVIGDVMVDSYIWGQVERISPEAPVPIVSINKSEHRLGGAGNVARNIHSLGATPILCSVVGNDIEGKIVMDLLQDEDISSQGIVLSNERQTTVKRRILSGSQQLLRVDKEDRHTLLEKEKKELFRRIEGLVTQVDAVIFEDYDKGVIDSELIGMVTEKANSRQIPIIVDPKKRNFHDYKNATLFKPNFKEIREGLDDSLNLDDFESFTKTINEFTRKMTIEGVLLTLSERGVYIHYNNEQHLIPAHVRNIADVSGAGDTVVSVAAMCMALGLSPKIVGALSNLAGGIVCEYVGVVPIDKTQLMVEADRYKIFE